MRRQHTYHESCHLACVADFSVGRCYFDGMGEPYLAGMTGLWDYIRAFREEMKEGRRRDKAIYRKLKDGEVLLQDDVLYCRLGEHGVSFFVETDGEDQESGEGVIEVLMQDNWEYPRRANISKKDGELLRVNIRDYLMSRGYRQIRFL